MKVLLPIQIQDNMPGGLFHKVPIESGIPDRQELSEAECDIDTLKKLKLGMRSSLWSRPNTNTSAAQQEESQLSGHPSDYSIAV